MKESKTHEPGNYSASTAQDDVPDLNPNEMQDVVEVIGAWRIKDTIEEEVESVGDQNPGVAYPAVVLVDVVVKNVSSGVLDVVFDDPTEGWVANGDRSPYKTVDVSMSLREIAPGAERTICLTAAVISPGRYNMCRFTMLNQTSSFVPNRRRQPIAVRPSFMTVEVVENHNFYQEDLLEEQTEIAPLRRSSTRMSVVLDGRSTRQMSTRIEDKTGLETRKSDKEVRAHAVVVNEGDDNVK
ncbi:unnamed protein product [Agarophyton chilense]